MHVPPSLILLVSLAGTGSSQEGVRKCLRCPIATRCKAAGPVPFLSCLHPHPCSLLAFTREVRFGTTGHGNTHGKSSPGTARLCLSHGPALTTPICLPASALGGSTGELKAEEQNVSFWFVACARVQGQQEACRGLGLASSPPRKGRCNSSILPI